ncbi:MAG TPA: exopolysaccharide biosynthesis protein [Devosia sp.]|uniref:exopolysaccharide biosynthesis protein n=1 Tax=Devosia sp. TaxID=1871048 RepID=UPI0027361FC2|nr:exopolysaccharide biosynthesis protein [Devosia sp.]MDP2779424.1 exopolysaccharide biosynthesis protein [Devosia sp.]HLV83010.1 exopolysaccharide biosynthesis protein [Devosia sp.]
MGNARDGALGEIVAKVEQRVADGEKISIGMIQAVAGQRMAGPMLLFPALIVVSPLSIIPGLPSLVGLTTILVAGQVVLGHEKIWLPRWLTERCLSSRQAERLMSFLKPVSATIDAVSKRRWHALVSQPIRRAGAVVCVLVGAIMPFLELIPFTSTGAGAIIALFGLALTARDGMVALAWIGLVTGMIGVAALLLV